jgi:glycosyltransferase involved in cell wall biosynthesis
MIFVLFFFINTFERYLNPESMPKISVAIITLNEEQKIERCLLSVKDFADEIIVVDSLSTDKTEEICKKFGAVFILHKFEGYIEQKRFCFAQARYDHILSIDADEAVSDELRASILAVKENWTHDGYEMNRLNSFCGQWIHHSGWYPDRKLRLFDRRKVQVKGKNPHDEMVINPGIATRKLKGDLLHYTYLTVADQVHQINRFTDIQARERFEQGKKANWLAIFFSPCYKFIRHYFFRLGFLDGYNGFLLCRNMAYSTFLKHAKLKALRRSAKC